MLPYNNRGNAFAKLGWKEEAIKDYTKAIELNPEYALAYNNRGKALEDLGERAEAIKDYTKAIELDPQYISKLAPIIKQLSFSKEEVKL